jgi:ABC-type phosphate transport system substrate-binding protein
MRAIVLAILLVASAAAPGGDAARADTPPAYVVIVHPSNKATRLEKKTIADVFLKKRTRWSAAGRTILPVDLTKKSAIRKRFSEEVLGRNLSAVRTYWNQLVFSGRGVPPPEVDSDADVIAYVLEHPGAIGYVSASADVKDARVVQIK